MRNKKIIEFQCRLRYKQLIKDAGVGEIFEFRYGSIDDNIGSIIKQFGLSSSQPYSKLDYLSDKPMLQEWFYENAQLVINNCHNFWIITAGDIAWVNVYLANPIADLFKLWLASSKDMGCVTEDFKWCFDFSTYENSYEFHKVAVQPNCPKLSSPTVQNK